MGEQKLKNIEKPIRVYSVSLEGAVRNTRDQAPSQEEKPSVAVLHFNNISGNPEQEYFSEGITEDIITDLSKISGLSVVARHTAFIYKGKPVNVREVGRKSRSIGSSTSEGLTVHSRSEKISSPAL